MAMSEDVLKTLQSIDTTLRQMLLESRLDKGVKPQHKASASMGVAEMASDADLDGPYGDPEVRIGKSPRGWDGDSMKGRKFSECPAAYLDALANLYDWAATQETDPKVSGYKRKDAARARGWAARIRAGYAPTLATATDAFGDTLSF